MLTFRLGVHLGLLPCDLSLMNDLGAVSVVVGCTNCCFLPNHLDIDFIPQLCVQRTFCCSDMLVTDTTNSKLSLQVKLISHALCNALVSPHSGARRRRDAHAGCSTRDGLDL